MRPTCRKRVNSFSTLVASVRLRYDVPAEVERAPTQVKQVFCWSRGCALRANQQQKSEGAKKKRCEPLAEICWPQHTVVGSWHRGCTVTHHLQRSPLPPAGFRTSWACVLGSRHMYRSTITHRWQRSPPRPAGSRTSWACQGWATGTRAPRAAAGPRRPRRFGARPRKTCWRGTRRGTGACGTGPEGVSGCCNAVLRAAIRDQVTV